MTGRKVALRNSARNSGRGVFLILLAGIFTPCALSKVCCRECTVQGPAIISGFSVPIVVPAISKLLVFRFPWYSSKRSLPISGYFFSFIFCLFTIYHLKI